LYSHLWFLSALAKTHMTETKTKTSPETTALKKPDGAILDAGWLSQRSKMIPNGPR